MTKQQRRLSKERQAAAFVEEHHGPIADLCEEVAVELGAELVGLSVAAKDARIAAEVAYRLDRLIDLSSFGPLAEALDWFGFFLAALAVLGVMRAIERRAKRQGLRADRLRDLLEKRGPQMTRVRRRAVERKIARLTKA